MERAIGLLGLLVLLAIAWLLSENRRRLNWRLIFSGLALQALLALILLHTALGQVVFDLARLAINKVIAFSNDGARFVFGDLVETALFGFSVLPMVIFVSSITSVLFYLGWIQWVVRQMARVMVRVMGASGSESMAAAANVYLGASTAPLVILPYLKSMTRSEIMAVMTSGMATVAGSVLAAYVALGADAGHLLAASLMSAPAALVIAKIMTPETGVSPTMGVVTVDVPKPGVNFIDAACSGASDGLKLALERGRHADRGDRLRQPVQLGRGTPSFRERRAPFPRTHPGMDLCATGPAHGRVVGRRPGRGHADRQEDHPERVPGLPGPQYDGSPAFGTLVYHRHVCALCSFANFGTIAIMIGGIGGLVPERRQDIARYGIRSMIGGALAANMTATVAGLLM